VQYGLAIDSIGRLLVCDCHNHVLRQITLSDRDDNEMAHVTTIAGNARQYGYHDSANPLGAFFECNNVFIADLGNYLIRRLDAESGCVTTFAGFRGRYDASVTSMSADGNEPMRFSTLHLKSSSTLRQVLYSSVRRARFE